jgi:hypothetical protein
MIDIQVLSIVREYVFEEWNSTQRALAEVSRKPTGRWLAENEAEAVYPRVRWTLFLSERSRNDECLAAVEVKDYDPIIQAIDECWGGLLMAGILQRLFFEHFQPTSFVIELDAEIVGFLVGFRSQTTLLWHISTLSASSQPAGGKALAVASTSTSLRWCERWDVPKPALLLLR